MSLGGQLGGALGRTVRSGGGRRFLLQDDKAPFVSFPPMPSNVSPAGHVASASSQFDASYAPFNAFANNGPEPAWAPAATATPANPQWIERQLPTSARIWAYEIQARSTAPGEAPIDWQLLAGRDGGGLVLLDSRTAAPGWSAGEKRRFMLLEATEPFTRFRLQINAAAAYGSIGELTYLEAVENI